MPRNRLLDNWRRCAVSLSVAFWLFLLGVSPALAAARGDVLSQTEPPSQGFYSQAAGYGQGFGYIIPDVPDGPQFYAIFQALGGGAVLGYPLASPFTDSATGDIYLVLQRAVLVWHNSTRQISIANTFELLDNEGLEQWLLDRGIPQGIEDDGGATFAESRSIRLSWLTDQGIANQFLQNPLDPGNLEISILLYGLPMTYPQKIGPFIVQRFQRAAFQRWVESVPGQPVPGTVTQVFAGILYKEANLIPMEAFRPEPNPFDKPSDELLAQARSLLAAQQVTAHLVPYLEHAIIGYAPDLLDTAALRVGDWAVIYLHPALKDARYEALAAVLAHLATYLEAHTLSPVPLEHTRETCKRLVSNGLRVEAALWQALWGSAGTYNAKAYEEILNGYVAESQESSSWADFIAEIHCT